MTDISFDTCKCGAVTVSSATAVAELKADNERLRAALLEIIRLDDGWVPAAQDDYTYGGYMACADIARTALGGDT
jgi:hypothetical protein